MQSEQRHSLKKKNHSTNRFNDSEYERWSEGITTAHSTGAPGGIDGFLGTTENEQLGGEEFPGSLTGIGKK